MPTTAAGRQYSANLQFFSELRNRNEPFQLQLNNETGLFYAYNGTGFTRTIGNIFSGSGSKQSVNNDAMFTNPIKDVFTEAILNGADQHRITQAFDGIIKVSKYYTSDPVKSKKINQLIYELKSLTGINLKQNTLSQELSIEYRNIDPKTALSVEDRDFIGKIWLNMPDLIKSTKEATEKPPYSNRKQTKPYAVIADKIYRLYNSSDYIGVKITDIKNWVSSLPKMPTRIGSGLYLQHSGVFLTSNQLGQIVTNPDYGADFIYYSIGHKMLGAKLWRIYLNFEANQAATILNFLMDQSKRNLYPIHSFKIAGPEAFHRRVDKIVIYIYGRVEAIKLAGALQKIGGFEDPVPAMTQKQHVGIALGIEPESLETGFSAETDPTEARRQSYGSIRAQLIAAALIHFYDNAEYAKQIFNDEKCTAQFYLTKKEFFEKWVAIAFKHYKEYLEPS